MSRRIQRTVLKNFMQLSAQERDRILRELTAKSHQVAHSELWKSSAEVPPFEHKFPHITVELREPDDGESPVESKVLEATSEDGQGAASKDGEDRRPETAIVPGELFDSRQHADHPMVSRANSVFDFFEHLMPKKLCREEFGDALEIIHRDIARGRAPKWIRLKVYTTVFFVVLNAVRAIASSFFGRRPG